MASITTSVSLTRKLTSLLAGAAMIAGMPMPLAAHSGLAGQDMAVPSAHAPVTPPSLAEQRNFDLVVRISEGEFGAGIAGSPSWAAASKRRAERIRLEMIACANDAACRVRAILWTEEEAAAALEALRSALGPSGRLAALAAELRASGSYALHADKPDQDLIALAWRDVTEGHNRILRIYGLGEAPRYPAIDAILFTPDGDLWPGVLTEATDHLLAAAPDHAGPRADLAHRFALQLLYFNDRENAASFADVDTRHNAAARAQIAALDWTRYPYTVILVLGDGPDRPGQLIGTYGKLRLARAAQLYHEGLAPVLIVSGGNVHPALTPINEAVEMKRELMTRYAIPESAIIIEPHARHTTTNFRNSARLMLRYGIPMDRPAIATTSTGHSLYAGGEPFDVKAMEELGYVPRRVIKRLTPYEFAFLPDPRSTHRDNRDPLDP
jgi:hypothetical protein